MNEQNQLMIIIGTDLDGCYFGWKYIDEKSPGNKNAVVDANKACSDKICEDIKKKKPSEVMVTSFSNRGCNEIDELNAKIRRTELSTEAMPKIYEYFKSQLEPAGIKCIAEDYALAHLFSGKEPDPAKIFDFPSIDASKYYFDESKFIQLYMQLHRAAIQQTKEAPEKKVNIEYHALDDYDPILKDFCDVAEKDGNGDWYSTWFPEGVLIYFYLYSGKDEAKCLHKIRGAGKIDEAYQQNIIKLSEKIFSSNSNKVMGGSGTYKINVIPVLKKYKNLESFLPPEEEDLPGTQDTLSFEDDEEDGEEENIDKAQNISKESAERKRPAVEFFTPPEKRQKGEDGEAIPVKKPASPRPGNSSGDE